MPLNRYLWSWRYLNHFKPVCHFYTHCTFSGGIEMEHWLEIGWSQQHRFLSIVWIKNLLVMFYFFTWIFIMLFEHVFLLSGKYYKNPKGKCMFKVNKDPRKTSSCVFFFFFECLHYLLWQVFWQYGRYWNKVV